jgi:hypothetical protein
MPRPLGNQIISGLPQAHPATAVALDAIQYLINSRPLRQPAQLTRQVLLQRLAAPLGPALQSSVHVVGDITYQQVRHAYIMLSPWAAAQGSKAPPHSTGGTVSARTRRYARLAACTA